MRLAKFDGGRIGIIVPGDAPADDRIVDISDLAPLPVGTWPPVAEIALIAQFAGIRPALEAAAAQRPAQRLAEVRLEAPVTWPNKLLAYPANYHAHIAEMSSQNRADKNGFFLKAPSSISGPNDPIVIPDIDGREVHHECELAIVIGKGGRHVARADALAHIFGYACLVDMTVRGQEERVMRKSFDTFCPLGPWIVTADEIDDPDRLDLQLTVNGEVRQQANTRDLIVDVRDMIVLASSVSTLYPGDVIATGTPEGVGPLAAGDTVVITIAGVGSMTLPVVQGQGGSNIAFEHHNALRAAGEEDRWKSGTATV
ncbi:MAG: fumarylacetoacetate hydrolase family protein [Acidobacteria bacterium]|nr:fumarylacetoacetate hydrolase family protein [Acidobacteriota bacterium]